jgi:hypothetical protein
LAKNDGYNTNNNVIKICIDQNLPNTDQILRSADIAKVENPLNVPLVKIRKSFGGPSEHDPLSMAILTGTRWENGRVLKVRFLNGIEQIHTKVEQIAKEWERYANIKLQFIQNGNAEIRIAFKWNGDRGSWSALGTDALLRNQTRPTMNFGWLETNTSNDEYNRVVLHEFGHALGCIHEHQNPHPSGEIPWDKDAVYTYYMGAPNNWKKEDVDHNLFRKYNQESTNFSEFDRESIMTYWIPNEHTIGDFEVPRNKQLSQTDKSFIQSIYPFESKPIVEILVGASAIEADIGEHGEEDLYSFEVKQKGQHIIETSGSTDVVMGLLGPNTQTDLIDEDDDSGVSRNAKISADLQPGIYHIRVSHYRSTGTGTYKISVRQ